MLKILVAGTNEVHLEDEAWGDEPPGSRALECRVTRDTATGSLWEGPAPSLLPLLPTTLLICLVDTILPSLLYFFIWKLNFFFTNYDLFIFPPCYDNSMMKNQILINHANSIGINESKPLIFNITMAYFMIK